ncbi:MAG: glucuronate isomerase [Phycisphaerae bacterium]
MPAKTKRKSAVPAKLLTTRSQIEKVVTAAVTAQPIVDMHTHLYPPTFGTPVTNRTGKADPAGMLLWGLDELLTYHYLVAEVYRIVPASKLPYDAFWKMSKQAQADHIWKHLFVERTPISEACRGVLTCMEKLGLEVDTRKDLTRARKWFAAQDPSKYVDKVMEISNVESITMTNAVFDDNERNRWLANPKVGQDPRFTGVLRIDPILRNWPLAAKKMTEWGYPCSATVDAQSITQAQKFLRDWLDRVAGIYMAVSLPPEFKYPVESNDPAEKAGQDALEKIVLPVCAERNIPFAMMIGSKMRVNPALGDAGDMVGTSDVGAVVRLCAQFPQNKFFVTMLARENVHALCVAARKFGNLMVFGCWWFLNNPSLIEEITRMRLELLGTTMIPQHSDARVLDQLLYKWDHSRQIIGKVLVDKYTDTAATGWPLTAADIQKDVYRMFKGNFQDFLAS